MKWSLAPARQLTTTTSDQTDRRRDSPASNPIASGLCNPGPRPNRSTCPSPCKAAL
jgi:hypothetical protein